MRALGSVSQTRQFGRSLAGVLSGAAQNIKSKIAGMGAASPSASSLSSQSRGEVQQVRAESGANYSLTTGSSSSNLVEPAERSPQAEIQQREYGELGKDPCNMWVSHECVIGYPMRLEKRPLGPRDTPNFQKKQEYL